MRNSVKRGCCAKYERSKALSFAKSGGLGKDRKSTRLNSSHANISTLSLHDALPIPQVAAAVAQDRQALLDPRPEQLDPHRQEGERHEPADREHRYEEQREARVLREVREVEGVELREVRRLGERSEEHTSELQSRQYLHSFPTRRSSDPAGSGGGRGGSSGPACPAPRTACPAPTGGRTPRARRSRAPL